MDSFQKPILVWLRGFRSVRLKFEVGTLEVMSLYLFHMMDSGRLVMRSGCHERLNEVGVASSLHVTCGIPPLRFIKMS